MKKKILNCVLALIIAFITIAGNLTPVNAASTSSGTYCGIKWIVTDGTLKLYYGYADNNAGGNKWPTSITSVVTIGNIKLCDAMAKGMFYNCSKLTSIDTRGFDMSGVTNMSDMFGRCESLTALDVSKFDTSKVTNLYGTFAGCANLTSLDVSSWNTSNVTDMTQTFSDCRSLTSLDVSNWDTSNVRQMSNLFSMCEGLSSLNVSGWNTGNTTDMLGMFYGCKNLTSLDVSNFDTSNVTRMWQMFYYCKNLTSLNLSNFNTSNVTDTSWMFYNCSSLTSLNLSNFNTSSVTNMSWMFYNCSSLTSLDLSSFDGSKLSKTDNMFAACPNLETIKTFKTLPSGISITFTNTMYDTSDDTAHTNMDVANATLTKNKHIHSYDEIIVKQVTPYNAGIIQKTCSCGDTYTEEIPQLKFNIFVDKTTRIKGIAKGNELLFSNINSGSENTPFIIN